MKLSVLLSALLFISFSNSIDAQKKVAGVDFPAVMKVNKKVVTFNGGGLREKYTIDLYVVGLYLRKPSMNSEKVLNSTDEMAMRIKIVSSKVTRDKFVESVKEGFVKSPGATNIATLSSNTAPGPLAASGRCTARLRNRSDSSFALRQFGCTAPTRNTIDRNSAVLFNHSLISQPLSHATFSSPRLFVSAMAVAGMCLSLSSSNTALIKLEYPACAMLRPD